MQNESMADTAEFIGSRYILITQRVGGKRPLQGILADLYSEREQPLGRYSNKEALRATANAWAAMKDAKALERARS